MGEKKGKKKVLKKGVKKVKVPILGEEYFLTVFFGTPEQLAKIVMKETEGQSHWSYDRSLNYCRTVRGAAFSFFPEKNPIIIIDSTETLASQLSTIPHEAVHAAIYIAEKIGLEDSSGEFIGHSVSAVMRHCLPFMGLKE